MAGGLTKYRHLSRDSSARQALLRGLVTSLVKHEHIQTTYAKAKEAQRMAEKLITLAKRNNEPCKRSAQGILYVRRHRNPEMLTLETKNKSTLEANSRHLLFENRPLISISPSFLAPYEKDTRTVREATHASFEPSP